MTDPSARTPVPPARQPQASVHYSVPPPASAGIGTMLATLAVALQSPTLAAVVPNPVLRLGVATVAALGLYIVGLFTPAPRWKRRP